MHHASIQDEIPAYVVGRLAPDMRLRVEAHLVECRDCREFVEGCESLVRELQAEGVPGSAEHPPPLDLKAFARRPDASPQVVAVHIETCPSCALELEIWKGMQDVAPPRTLPPPARSGMPRTALGFLAGAAASLLAMMLWWGEPGPPPTSAVDRAPNWLVLEETMRGTSSSREILVAPDQTLVPIGILLRVSSQTADSVRVRFTIRDSNGNPSWEHGLSAGEVRARLETGLVLLQVPAVRLPAGEYTLSVAPENADPGDAWFEIAFVVSES